MVGWTSASPLARSPCPHLTTFTITSAEMKPLANTLYIRLTPEPAEVGASSPTPQPQKISKKGCLGAAWS